MRGKVRGYRSSKVARNSRNSKNRRFSRKSSGKSSRKSLRRRLRKRSLGRRSLNRKPSRRRQRKRALRRRSNRRLNRLRKGGAKQPLEFVRAKVATIKSILASTPLGSYIETRGVDDVLRTKRAIKLRKKCKLADLDTPVLECTGFVNTSGGIIEYQIISRTDSKKNRVFYFIDETTDLTGGLPRSYASIDDLYHNDNAFNKKMPDITDSNVRFLTLRRASTRQRSMARRNRHNPQAHVVAKKAQAVAVDKKAQSLGRNRPARSGAMKKNWSPNSEWEENAFKEAAKEAAAEAPRESKVKFDNPEGAGTVVEEVEVHKHYVYYDDSGEYLENVLLERDSIDAFIDALEYDIEVGGFDDETDAVILNDDCIGFLRIKNVNKGKKRAKEEGVGSEPLPPKPPENLAFSKEVRKEREAAGLNPSNALQALKAGMRLTKINGVEFEAEFVNLYEDEDGELGKKQLPIEIAKVKRLIYAIDSSIDIKLSFFLSDADDDAQFNTMYDRQQKIDEDTGEYREYTEDEQRDYLGGLAERINEEMRAQVERGELYGEYDKEVDAAGEIIDEKTGEHFGTIPYPTPVRQDTNNGRGVQPLTRRKAKTGKEARFTKEEQAKVNSKYYHKKAKEEAAGEGSIKSIRLRVIDELTTTLGRKPTEEEIAERQRKIARRGALTPLESGVASF